MLRCHWNKEWQVYTENSEWVTVESKHQLVAYYLEILDIGILQHQKQNQVGELFQCLMC